MKTGKIQESILKRSVLKMCAKPQGNLLQGAGVGNDSAVFEGENDLLALTTASAVISASREPKSEISSDFDECCESIENSQDAIFNIIEKRTIRYTLEHAVNNLACSGCVAESVMLSLTLPAEAEEQLLKELMRTAKEECEALHLLIAGGHTEVTPAVTAPLLQMTALGRNHGKYASTAEILPGMDLLVVQPIAREGTSLLAYAHEEALKKRFPRSFVEQAKELGEHISIASEAMFAIENGAVGLHDLSQGGVFGALWELCEGAKVGMTADLRKIPIRQETVEVCEYFGKNPYCLISGGSFLAAAPKSAALEKKLQALKILAVKIGETTASNDRVLINGEERRFLDRPAQDEIWKGTKGYGN